MKFLRLAQRHRESRATFYKPLDRRSGVPFLRSTVHHDQTVQCGDTHPRKANLRRTRLISLEFPGSLTLNAHIADLPGQANVQIRATRFSVHGEIAHRLFLPREPMRRSVRADGVDSKDAAGQPRRA